MEMVLDFNHFDDFLLLFTTGVNFVPFVSYHLVSYHLVSVTGAQLTKPRERMILDVHLVDRQSFSVLHREMLLKARRMLLKARRSREMFLVYYIEKCY